LVRINTNKRLGTLVKNLSAAGDGVGVCGNIVGVAATGTIAARGVLEGTTVCSIPARKNKDWKV
jgi:uncharacterized FAD-dependent dehydrogenase